jgi:chitinase
VTAKLFLRHLALPPTRQLPMVEGSHIGSLSRPPCISVRGQLLKFISNVRYRSCERIDPSHIHTDGLTHLNFAFASIDPISFNITPVDPGDFALYSQFTALKSADMQTWVAIGGFDFSDPGPTHTTWSDMMSTSANRAAFISSLIDFMTTWGFQGVDIDWEYPANPDRGGRPEDTQNLVSLLADMRAAFGAKYGISVTL